jgi:poly(beta-D-mannuronate) lyase
MMRAFLSTVATALLLLEVASGDDRLVATVDELHQAIEGSQPGDSIVMRDGVWQGPDILLDAQGTAEKPVTLRAETPGNVIISGASRLRIGGRHLVVSGLHFRRAHNDDHLIVFRRDSKQLAVDCRLTNCMIEDCNHPTDAGESRWISLYGQRNRVDHCSISGKTGKGTTLVAFLGEEPSRHRIDRNYFGPREKLGKNGGETIRLGDSDTAHMSSQTTVEMNCFEACNGEAEIISNKSCDNVYRRNTFLRCAGALTLRHGNGATVEANYFLGRNAKGTGGVRIIGERHRVINNYFSDLEGDDHRAALSIMNGFENSPANGYAPVKDAMVAFNAFVNCKETIVIGLSEEDDPNVPPTDCVIANNLIVTRRKAIDVRTTPVNCRWQGNLVQGDLGLNVEGIREVVDLKLRRSGDLWSPTENSAARGSAVTGFVGITEDIHGRKRGSETDVGCEVHSDDTRVQGPIYPNDAGVTWARRK